MGAVCSLFGVLRQFNSPSLVLFTSIFIIPADQETQASPSSPQIEPSIKMKSINIIFTILTLMALQFCQANPISLLESPHKRQHHQSLAARALQFAAEVKEFLSARSPSLSIRFTESPDNGTSTSNSTTSPPPDNCMSTFNSTTSSSPSNTTAPAGEYIVEAGDTFDSIAVKLGTTVTALETANPELDPEDLQAGELVVIPGNFDGNGNGAAIGNETVSSSTDMTSSSPSSSASGSASSGWFEWIDWTEG
jgi:LysM repeat protein